MLDLGRENKKRGVREISEDSAVSGVFLEACDDGDTRRTGLRRDDDIGRAVQELSAAGVDEEVKRSEEVKSQNWVSHPSHDKIPREHLPRREGEVESVGAIGWNRGAIRG